MRPWIFGISLVTVWLLASAGVLANLQGVQPVANAPEVLERAMRAPPVPGRGLAGFDMADASVPLTSSGAPCGNPPRCAM